MNKDDPRVDHDPYAPPASSFAIQTPRFLKGRLWIASIVAALLLIALFFLGFAETQSPMIRTFLLLAFWIVPVLWILLPTLNEHGLHAVTWRRFFSTSLGFAAATIAFTVTILMALLLIVMFLFPFKD